jgi:hypothetical protein
MSDARSAVVKDRAARDGYLMSREEAVAEEEGN